MLFAGTSTTTTTTSAASAGNRITYISTSTDNKTQRLGFGTE